VTAEDNVSWNNYASKIYEAAKYDIELGAIAASFVVVLNQKDFQSLSPMDQDAVRKAAIAANAALQRQRNSVIANAIAGFKSAGLTVMMPDQLDLPSFRTAISNGVPKVTDPAYVKLANEVQDYIVAQKLK
jgi:TRAP-type C4-dicarboxylate transport system substrate-binding protein